MALNPDSIPAELKAQPRWVGWHWEANEQEKTFGRVFVSIRSGMRVGLDQEGEFATYEEALAGRAGAGFSGLAFAADDTYVVLTRMNYRKKPERNRVAQLDSYAELNWLEDEVTVVARATLTGNGGEVRYGKKERWTIISGRQFIPLTGNHIAGTPATVEERTEQFERLRKSHSESAESVSQNVAAGVPSEQTVVIASLNTEVAAGVRVRLSPETVDRYAENMTDGESLGQVVVFRDSDGTLWLADGFHRVEAAKKNGRTEIEADVREGGKRDAFLYAAGANLRHGLAATTEDRKKVASLLLNDPEWGVWGDREIGRRCGLDGKTVAKLRTLVSADAPQMDQGVSAEHPQTRTVIRNGVQYQQKVRKPANTNVSLPEPVNEVSQAKGLEVATAENPTPSSSTTENGASVPVPRQPNWASDPVNLDYLIASGLLFKINHEVLNPLGITLVAHVLPDGQKTGAFKDMRKEPAECKFDSATYDSGKQKLDRFMKEFGQEQLDRRAAKLGRVRQ